MPATPPPTEPATTAKPPATTAKPPATTEKPPADHRALDAAERAPAAGHARCRAACCSADGRFTTYLGLLRDAGLADSLAMLGPVTVFAPIDQAFAALPPGQLDAARADPDKLYDLLLAGMAKGRLTADQLSAGATVTSLSDTVLTIGTTGSTMTVNNAPVLSPELAASNGIVHPISAVPA